MLLGAVIANISWAEVTRKIAYGDGKERDMAPKIEPKIQVPDQGQRTRFVDFRERTDGK